jgi:hypothetical protein
MRAGGSQRTRALHGGDPGYAIAVMMPALLNGLGI